VIAEIPFSSAGNQTFLKSSRSFLREASRTDRAQVRLDNCLEASANSVPLSGGGCCAVSALRKLAATARRPPNPGSFRIASTRRRPHDLSPQVRAQPERWPENESGFRHGRAMGSRRSVDLVSTRPHVGRSVWRIVSDDRYGRQSSSAPLHPSDVCGGSHCSLFPKGALLDAVLVRRFTPGTKTRLAKLSRVNRQKMFSIALSHLGNHADAEEIAQDTFIRAYRGLASSAAIPLLLPGLRIAFNLSRNRYGYFFRRHRHETDSLDCAAAATRK